MSTIYPEGTCEIQGVRYPAVGFGTYRLKGEICSQAIKNALSEGYRIIDTATFYENFSAIATAIQSERENIYLISKVWPLEQTRSGITQDLHTTLQALQTEYLDAYLLHWPNSQIPIEETLSTMKEVQAQGLIRHIGLSNFTINHLKRVLQLNIPITWLQIEMHPFFYDAELVKFCQEHAILVQAWAPFGQGRVTKDVLLSNIGSKYGKTASQVAIKWILQHNCLPLPCSTNRDHVKENQDMADFTLSKEEMDEIDKRAKSGQRFRVTKDLNIGFTDEFDFSYEECWPAHVK